MQPELGSTVCAVERVQLRLAQLQQFSLACGVEHDHLRLGAQSELPFRLGRILLQDGVKVGAAKTEGA